MFVERAFARPGRADRFMVIEKWESVEHHKASLANYPQEKMQAAMPLIGGTPTGRYFTA